MKRVLRVRSLIDAALILLERAEEEAAYDPVEVVPAARDHLKEAVLSANRAKRAIEADEEFVEFFSRAARPRGV